MALESFSVRFESYINDIKRVHTEASKSYNFLRFIQDIFSDVDLKDSNQLFPYLERYLSTRSEVLGIKGRPDALLGNLIIEFKDELTQRKLNVAKDELKKYFSIIWENEIEKPEYTLLATDGLQIYVFRPNLLQMKLFSDEDKIIIPDRIGLEQISYINLEKSNPKDAYLWLDRYFLTKDLQPPTTENFLHIFGRDSPVYMQSISLLKEKWEEKHNEPHIYIMYEEWERYLEIVYGSKIGGVGLFLRHTYLATLSKLLATIFYSNGAFPSPEDTLKTFTGESFREWGIENFLEYDFFSWIIRIGEDFTLFFSRNLIDKLRTFDLSKLSEDILKGLYQELIDPEERHDLGEYYTPDWLSEYITRNLITNYEGSVLDPACGSGTFLFSVIKNKIKHYEENHIKKDVILLNIIKQVFGMDIHPVAVITSKVNYLLSLGDLIKYKKEPIVIPVFLADSIKLPRYEKILEGVDCYSFKINSENLNIPSKIIKSELLANLFFSYLKTAIDESILLEQFKDRIITLFEMELNEYDINIMVDLYKILYRFKEVGKDTIWTYILKNTYKPIFLSEKKFDYIIGNPPWISYRYFGGTDYQEFLKQEIIAKYNLLDKDQVQLITQLEYGSLFFVKASDLYLKDDGKIAFILPRGIFSADQHNNFRCNKFNLKIKLSKIIDLNKVNPLFNISSCVVFGEKNQLTEYPIKGEKLIGKLNEKNSSLKDALENIQIISTNYYVNKIGNRTFIDEKYIDLGLSHSYYLDKFQNGATIYPRNFWFVDVVNHPIFGINPEKPYLETSSEINRVAKEPYKDIIIKGNVERKYIYASIRGTEVVPFGYTNFKPVILPIIKLSNKYKVLNINEINSRTDEGIKTWINEIENLWQQLKSERTKEDCIEWINYRNKIELQNPNSKFIVLYLTSGTYLAACLIDNKNADYDINIENNKIGMNGFVADHKTYYFETDNFSEAIYITTILNAPIVDN